MRIEQAELQDAPSVMQLIALCTRELRTEGIDQWDENYPILEVVEQNARGGSLFLIREIGTCIAAVCLDEVQPDEFSGLPWRCKKGRALVVHRLCVHPDWQRRGVARQIMEFAENYAIEQRFSCIRLDAYTGNPRAIALYEGRGYERIGQTYFPRRKLPFDCFEKTLERFIIRRASDTDAEAIADAHRDSILTIGSHFYPNDVVEAWGDAIRPSMYVHAMETGEIFFIAVEGSVVLGFSSHHVVDGQHRTAVYVRGSHARQGVGRALYRMAEDAARRAGATSVHVDASLAAVEFYKRNGLDEVARGEHRLAAGQPMACVFMRKTLTA